MTMRRFVPGSNIVATGAMLFLITTLSSSAIAESALERYMDQPPPGTSPELFAPGVVNTDAVELNNVFAPDESYLIFTSGRREDGWITAPW
jgi:hypothetical protein